MHGLILLALVTLLYAGYNLFVKMSSGHVADKVTSTVLATMCLQFTALVVSTLFAIYLLRKGGQVLQLSPSAYGWAAAAGHLAGSRAGFPPCYSNLTQNWISFQDTDLLLR